MARGTAPWSKGKVSSKDADRSAVEDDFFEGHADIIIVRVKSNI